MPDISKRGQNIPASPIRKLVPFARAARDRGTKIYLLNIGQPDIKTPENAIEAIKQKDIKVLGYSHSAGNETYRRKLVNYYKTFGVTLDYTDIIVTTGASEALAFTLMACLDEGDELIVPEPFYANYNSFSLSGGINIRPITAKIEDDFALPPIAEFEKLITANTKGILICNPSNPTGYLYSKEELIALKKIAKKHDLFLFVDEVYREFCYGDKKFHSVLTLSGVEQNVIVFDSISKRYSACGARIGMVVSRNKVVMDAVMRFAQARLSPPTLAQIVAEATLDTDPSYLKEVIKEYDNRRKTLIKRLQAMDDVICPNTGGAFYVFAQLPIDDSETFCRWLLEAFEYKGATVMMAPGSGFYATKGLGKQEVRIAYVLKEDDLHKAMDCLEAALNVYPGRLKKEDQGMEVLV